MKQTITLIILACFLHFYNDTGKNLNLKIYYGKKVIKSVKMRDSLIKTVKLPTPAIGNKFRIYWYTNEPKTGAKNDVRKDIVTCGENIRLFEITIPKEVKDENVINNFSDNIIIDRVHRPSRIY
ncbi:MAG: hypothetical protein PVG65_05225 [Candidatus Thorarchaeota archaeon]|jgi:hypothetical protein